MRAPLIAHGMSRVRRMIRSDAQRGFGERREEGKGRGPQQQQQLRLKKSTPENNSNRFSSGGEANVPVDKERQREEGTCSPTYTTVVRKSIWKKGVLMAIAFFSPPPSLFMCSVLETWRLWPRSPLPACVLVASYQLLVFFSAGTVSQLLACLSHSSF